MLPPPNHTGSDQFLIGYWNFGGGGRQPPPPVVLPDLLEPDLHEPDLFDRDLRDFFDFFDFDLLPPPHLPEPPVTAAGALITSLANCSRMLFFIFDVLCF